MTIEEAKKLGTPFRKGPNRGYICWNEKTGESSCKYECTMNKNGEDFPTRAAMRRAKKAKRLAEQITNNLMDNKDYADAVYSRDWATCDVIAEEQARKARIECYRKAAPRTSAIAGLNYLWLAEEDKVSPVNITDKWIERKEGEHVKETDEVKGAHPDRDDPLWTQSGMWTGLVVGTEVGETGVFIRARYLNPNYKEMEAKPTGADFQRGTLEGMRAANKAQRTFSTGAVRDTDNGKPRMDLIPPEALEALGHVLAEGAKHYGIRNWEKGIPLSSFVASAERHRCKVMRGEHDEDHDRRWLWNVMAFVTIAERVKAGKLPQELDDIGWTKEGK